MIRLKWDPADVEGTQVAAASWSAYVRRGLVAFEAATGARVGSVFPRDCGELFFEPYRPWMQRLGDIEIGGDEDGNFAGT